MKIVEKYKNEKLKPCPFCGGDGAMLIKYGDEYCETENKGEYE